MANEDPPHLNSMFLATISHIVFQSPSIVFYSSDCFKVFIFHTANNTNIPWAKKPVELAKWWPAEVPMRDPHSKGCHVDHLNAVLKAYSKDQADTHKVSVLHPP